MTLKGHKNLIASGATAASLPCWQLRAAVSFGLNPNTTATSILSPETSGSREQFIAGIVERMTSDYRLDRQQ
jgi:hypothetical protein